MRDYTITAPSMYWNQFASILRHSYALHRDPKIKQLLDAIDDCNRRDNPTADDYESGPKAANVIDYA